MTEIAKVIDIDKQCRTRSVKVPSLRHNWQGKHNTGGVI